MQPNNTPPTSPTSAPPYPPSTPNPLGQPTPMPQPPVPPRPTTASLSPLTTQIPNPQQPQFQLQSPTSQPQPQPQPSIPHPQTPPQSQPLQSPQPTHPQPQAISQPQPQPQPQSPLPQVQTPLQSQSQQTPSQPPQLSPPQTHSQPLQSKPQTTPKSRTPKLLLLATAFILLASALTALFILTRPNYPQIAQNFIEKLFTAKQVDVRGVSTFSLDPTLITVSYPIRSITIDHHTLSQALPAQSTAKVTVNLTDNTNYVLDLDLIFMSKDQLYFKFDNLDTFLLLYTKIQSNFFPQFNLINLKPFDDFAKQHQSTWWELSPSDLHATAPAAYTAKHLESTLCFIDNFNDFSGQSRKVASFHQKHPFFDLQKLQSNHAKDQKITAYELTLKKDETRDFLAALVKLPLFKNYTTCANSTPDLAQKFLKVADPNQFLNLFDLQGKTTVGLRAENHELVNFVNEHQTKFAKITHKYDFAYPTEKTTIPTPLGSKKFHLLAENFHSAVQLYQKYGERPKPKPIEIPKEERGCSYYQGSDPTDRCYRAGCGSSLDANQNNPLCLPAKSR